MSNRGRSKGFQNLDRIKVAGPAACRVAMVLAVDRTRNNHRRPLEVTGYTSIADINSGLLQLRRLDLVRHDHGKMNAVATNFAVVLGPWLDQSNPQPKDDPS